MQRGLQTFLTGFFRSRWIVAVALAVIVVAIVALARLLAGPAPARVLDAGDRPAPSISVDPHGDDSVTSTDPPPAPKVSPGTARPEAVGYAFASAWADHNDVSAKEWRDRLLPHVTKDLAGKLADTDPESIPADRVTGEPALTSLGSQLVEVRVATDAGELSLQLVAPDGRWLVDSVGWKRS
ncbi:hypothetical protein [Spirilliplanes yamanashiensis]|uniref:Uncharacterized protein n=1 Tax=Spirilliplanes yamanashiensis TaxID=42233 RepID=A0A8J4DID4_9ACTN|nr:hypothetical protein [Spirilliplanes yamanashiensis]MDP9814596.1 hypothetical protein [Spirilliplanes yamanashiensis]GIJ02249.1 hypothetical protein Sya03_16010 [Spirilliplanes yamanashiensis]